ncbi:hypothetical protein MWU52_16585 [Jannaschia sp. S6380]|nr:hypothetical protein [Jannaschia sp. S6380]MCK0169173.1 hypothetical protein [Jannaschia sp. S6380]
MERDHMPRRYLLTRGAISAPFRTGEPGMRNIFYIIGVVVVVVVIVSFVL